MRRPATVASLQGIAGDASKKRSDIQNVRGQRPLLGGPERACGAIPDARRG